jgi:hypothetical protein
MSLVVPMSGNSVIFAGTLTDTTEFPVSARGRLLSVFATGTAGNSLTVHGGVRNAAGDYVWELMATLTVDASGIDTAQLVDFGHPFVKLENASGTPKATVTWSN